MKANILELHREFLPSPETEPDMDSVSFTASVNAWKHLPKGEEEEKINFNWTANFFIRVGNTTVCLHNIIDDTKLVLMEQKLKTLREAILFFVKEVTQRCKKPGGEYLEKREWLNPPETDSKYTGYYFYCISPDGSSRFYLADCQRTIHFWLDNYHKDKLIVGERVSRKPISPYNKHQLLKLKAIANGLGRCIRSIHTLRKRFKDGEVQTKLLDENATE